MIIQVITHFKEFLGIAVTSSVNSMLKEHGEIKYHFAVAKNSDKNESTILEKRSREKFEKKKTLHGFLA